MPFSISNSMQILEQENTFSFGLALSMRLLRVFPMLQRASSLQKLRIRCGNFIQRGTTEGTSFFELNSSVHLFKYNPLSPKKYVLLWKIKSLSSFNSKKHIETPSTK
jgi:hypothetical protein